MRALVTMLLIGLATPAVADDFTVDAIEKRAGQVVLTEAQKTEAQIQGECLVGIKKINFTGGEFDPVEEWLRFRTSQLLEHNDPCTTLAMLEVAKRHLEAERAAMKAEATDG